MLNNSAALQDKYERLADIMNAHFSRPSPTQETIRAFKDIGIDITYTDNLAEQIRVYCEWNCTTFPIDIVKVSEALESVLFYEFRDELNSDDADISSVLKVMGFKKNDDIRQGASLRLKEIDLSFQKLQEEQQLTVPRLNRDEIHGITMKAFGYAEELLEYIISYYLRWFSAILLKKESALGTASEIPDALELGKEEEKILTNWISGKWDKLLFNKSNRIIRHLNQLVLNKGTELSLAYQTTFKSSPDMQSEFPLEQKSEEDFLILPGSQLDTLGEQFRNYRHKYAHLRGREETNMIDYLNEVVATVGHIRDFASFIVTNNIIPEVAIVRRRMTFGDGSIRLDCLHERSQELLPHRLPRFIRIYSHREREIECFFPWHVFRKLNNDDSQTEADYLRLIMPVDFHREDGIQLT
ncbi:MAG: hypothetical protein IAE79_13755 [Anaerolinea sp.]|nr:hypothetical protein [Anaerolinea sp.]